MLYCAVSVGGNLEQEGKGGGGVILGVSRKNFTVWFTFVLSHKAVLSETQEQVGLRVYVSMFVRMEGCCFLLIFLM